MTQDVGWRRTTGNITKYSLAVSESHFDLRAHLEHLEDYAWEVTPGRRKPATMTHAEYHEYRIGKIFRGDVTGAST